MEPKAASLAPRSALRPSELLKELTALQKKGGLSTIANETMQQAQREGPARTMRMLAPPPSIDKQERAVLKQKTKEWMEKYHVLGSNLKSNLRRPKELLNLSPGKGDAAKFFNSQIWELRSSVERAADKVIEIEDVHKLLRMKLGSLSMNQQQHELQKALSGGAMSVEYERLEVRNLQAKQRDLSASLATIIGLRGEPESEAGSRLDEYVLAHFSLRAQGSQGAVPRNALPPPRRFEHVSVCRSQAARILCVLLAGWLR